MLLCGEVNERFLALDEVDATVDSFPDFDFFRAHKTSTAFKMSPAAIWTLQAADTGTTCFARFLEIRTNVC